MGHLQAPDLHGLYQPRHRGRRSQGGALFQSNLTISKPNKLPFLTICFFCLGQALSMMLNPVMHH